MVNNPKDIQKNFKRNEGNKKRRIRPSIKRIR